MTLVRALPAVIAALLLYSLPARSQQAGTPPADGAGVPPAPAARPPVTRQVPERVNLVPAPGGNEARYRVRETLASLEFPTDAVGVTKSVSGNILVDATGKVVADSSRFVVDLRTLASDESRRDGYIRRNTLKTDSFPEIVFVPRAVTDLPRAPTSVPASFQLAGDLTVRGVTRPATWDVTVKQARPDVIGTATTSFSFKDFGMEIPRVGLLLSVRDTIRLEYDFHFVKAP